MSVALAGALGAAAGVIVAILGNVLVLPFVLRTQASHFPDNWRHPLLGWDRVKIAKITKLVYRVLMPLLFGIIGAVLAARVFGERP